MIVTWTIGRLLAMNPVVPTQPDGTALVDLATICRISRLWFDRTAVVQWLQRWTLTCKLTFDLLTLKVVSESRVTCATSVPILVFTTL